ncbi:MAG TPA: hypothetical protein VKG25_13935 [Bryobacteraceae bacterium]|nr:hypothetical protein [Bryobacteraceae bacterium]
MPELVTIPVSFLEVTIDYEKADIRLLADRAHVVQGIFEALLPWNAKIDDIEVLNSGKNSEQGVMFRVPQKRVAFFVGASLCRFSRDDVAWHLADETVTIFEAAVNPLTKLGGVVLGMKKTAVGLHLQPRAIPFMELLRPFVPTQLATLESDTIQSAATVVKWANRRVTIDGSASVANAIFIKLEREFAGDIPFGAIADQLSKDEQELLEIIGVKEKDVS